MPDRLPVAARFRRPPLARRAPGRRHRHAGRRLRPVVRGLLRGADGRGGRRRRRRGRRRAAGDGRAGGGHGRGAAAARAAAGSSGPWVRCCSAPAPSLPSVRCCPAEPVARGGEAHAAAAKVTPEQPRLRRRRPVRPDRLHPRRRPRPQRACCSPSTGTADMLEWLDERWREHDDHLPDLHHRRHLIQLVVDGLRPLRTDARQAGRRRPGGCGAARRGRRTRGGDPARARRRARRRHPAQPGGPPEPARHASTSSPPPWTS